MSSRKGMIRTNIPAKLKKSLNINMEINDEDIWYIHVISKSKTFNMPCRLKSMMERFDNQSESWDVKVIGKWNGDDTSKYTKFE